MIYSMTGFGRGETSGENEKAIVELKSVNHRFCNVNIKVPKRFSPIENEIRKYVEAKLKRGSIEVRVNWETMGEDTSKAIKVNEPLARNYYEKLVFLRDKLEIEDEVRIETLVRFPGVIEIEDAQEDLPHVLELIEEAIDGASKELLEMQLVEGASLYSDIEGRIEVMRGVLEEIDSLKDATVGEYRDKLAGRIKELLSGGESIDEGRLEMEVALFADRSDITEEIVRFKNHLDRLESVFGEGGIVGRQGEFILQEMNREVNTIGSKANSYSISEKVVFIKSELEKIREQIQNIK